MMEKLTNESNFYQKYWWIWIVTMLNQLYSLSLKQTQPQKETTRKDKCKGCEKEYPINDLRNHVKYCFLSIEFPESDEEHYELPDPFGEENITNLYDIQMDKSLQTSLDAASEMQLSQVTEHRSNWLPPAASVPVQP